MRIFLTALWLFCFVLIAGRAANAEDAKPHWRVVTTPNEPVLLAELDTAGEFIRSDKLLDSTDEVRAAAFNDGQTKLAVSITDRKIRIWDLTRNKAPSKPLELVSPVDAAAIIRVSPDGMWVASGDKHGRVTLWELKGGDNKLHTLRKPWLSHPVAILKFSPDSRWLFSASNDTNKYWYFGGLWKLDQQPFSNNAVRLNAKVNAFSSGFFAPGGRWFVTGHSNASWIWDLQSRDPSKNPVTVPWKKTQKGDVQLADGVWNLHRDGDAVTITRKTSPKATE